MWGAVIGDIAGSVYEHQEHKATAVQFFESGAHFSDDSVLTFAVMDTLLHNRPYAESYRAWGRRYPDAGYGKFFKAWLMSDDAVSHSFGNGAAMRVSPVAWWYDSLDEVLDEARRSAMVTHGHEDAVAGAQAVAASIFLARTGKSKADIRDYVSERFGYDLNLSHEQLVRDYTFDSTAPHSVPQAIFCFLISDDYEDCLVKAIRIGGDTDTIACMAGAIAEAYYQHIPSTLTTQARELLPEECTTLLKVFYQRVSSRFRP